MQDKENNANELVELPTDDEEVENTQSKDKTKVENNTDTEENVENNSDSTDSKSEDKTIKSNKQDESESLTKESNDKSTTKKSSKEKPKDNKPKEETSKKSPSKTEKPKTKKTKTEKPKADKPETKPPEKEKPVVIEKARVTISVSVPSAVSGPSYGPTSIEFNEGDSVFDILNKTGLKVNSSGRGTSIYVRGISGLKEFDEGPMSGWKYKVDGVFPGESAGSFEIKEGQQIEWVYTVDWTAD